MAHIEQNICPKITLEDFQEQRATKHIVKSFLADPENFKFPPGFDAEALIRRLGGRGRPAESSLIDYDIRGPIGSQILDPTNKSANVDLLNDRLLPEDEIIAGVKDMGLNKVNDDVTKDEPVTTPESPKSPTTVVASPVKEVTSPAEEDKPKTEEGQRYIENTNPWDPNSKLFKPANFVHPVTGKYVCPHPHCR